MIRRKYQEFGAIAFAAALPLALAACGQNPEANKQAAAPPPAVTVANPIQRTIVDQDEYVGRFVAVDWSKCGPASPAIWKRYISPMGRR